MPTAAIISKPQKPEMESILSELTQWLPAHGYQYILCLLYTSRCV